MNCFAIDAVNYKIIDAVNKVSWLLILGSYV